MRNKYPGKCITCGWKVLKGAGYLRKINKKLILFHLECPEKAERWNNLKDKLNAYK